MNLPVLNAMIPSNEACIVDSLKLIMETRARKIGFLGFSFKAGTDDLRESPVVEIIERLLGKGYEIKLYDKNINLAALIGANRDFILHKIPHIARLMAQEMEDVLAHADTLVIGNHAPEFMHISEALRPGQQVVDLVRAIRGKVSNTSYKGRCW